MVYIFTFSRCCNKVERKYIQEQQPNKIHCYGFCQQNGLERGQLQDWYPDEKTVVVPIFLNGRCCFSLRINKDEGDESLPFLVFRRHIVNAFFLKYSKEGRLSSSHVEIRNIPSDICCDVTKHYQVQCEHRRTQNPFKHLRWSVFAQIVNILKSLTGYTKTLSEYMPLLQNKAGLRCAKRTLDADT